MQGSPPLPEKCILGVEHDPYIVLDATEYPFIPGGRNLTLRDMARFNETIHLKGRYNGKQILPTSVVAKVRESANKSDFAKAGCAALAGGSYKSQWLINHNAYGAFNARGIHDQTNYVDHKAEMVIVRLGSNLQTSNVNFDHLSLPAYQAIAEKLMKAK